MQFVLKICNSNKINQVLYEMVHICVLLPVNIFLNSARSALLLAGGLLTEETCALLPRNKTGDITNHAGDNYQC